jgi:hypothetical protein
MNNILLAIVLALTIHPTTVSIAIHESITKAIAKMLVIPACSAIVYQAIRSLMLLVARTTGSESFIGSLFVRSFLPLIVQNIYNIGQEVNQMKTPATQSVEEGIKTVLQFLGDLTEERLGNIILT